MTHGHTEDLLGQWSFNINLDTSKLDLNDKKYIVENKKVVLEKVENGIIDNKDVTPQVELLEVSQSQMATKLSIYMEQYFTNVNYFIEIEDEHGNKILNDNIQKIYGGIPNEVILRKINLDSKIKINIYERTFDNELTAKGNLEIDLKNDLKEKQETNISYTKRTWKDLELKYDEKSEVYESDYSNENGETTYTIDFELYKTIGTKNLRCGYIFITATKNISNKNLENISQDIRNLNSFYAENLSYENIKEIKIDGENAITWSESYSGDVNNIYVFLHNGYIYEIKTPSSLSSDQLVDDFINNINLK